jgi:hypothetical protein
MQRALPGYMVAVSAAANYYMLVLILLTDALGLPKKKNRFDLSSAPPPSVATGMSVGFMAAGELPACMATRILFSLLPRNSMQATSV